MKWGKVRAGEYQAKVNGVTYSIEKNEYSKMWNLYVDGEWSMEEYTLKDCKSIANQKVKE